MKRQFFPLVVLAVLLFASVRLSAQSWLLAGNSDATNSSRLGTNNNVHLRLFTNGLERVRIDAATGKVGIGSTTPIGKLHVFNNGSVPVSSWVSAGTPIFTGFGQNTVGNGDFILSMASNIDNARAVFLMRRARGTLAAPAAVQANDFLGSFLASGYDGAAFQNPATIDFYADGAPSSGNVPGRISFVTGSNSANRAERMVIKSNGYVGVGTSTPVVPFDVSNPTAGFLGRFNGGANMYLALFESGVYRGYLGSFAGNAADVDLGTGGSNATGKLHLTIQASPKLTIDNLGNVGVGTTTPTSKFEVRRNDGSFLLAKFANAATTGDRTALVDFQNGNTTPTIWRMGVGGTGNGLGLTAGQFYIERAGIGSVMTFGANGNVGIGASSLLYKLNVNGTIRAKEVRVETGWADYVFEDGYKLRPLEEVEKYVRANKHLPGIPSAAEVQQNGLPVAEMQTKMMEKIEELTLYIIDLKKEIAELKKSQQ